ncbi:MAG: hypothetical protein JSU00_11530 [Acidobacteria bacterium]|nr:hypothetical protein [Acidobacteriota bacterium]
MKRPALKPELKLGAEPKKVAILAGLLAIGGIAYYINSSDSPSNSSSAKPASAQAPAPLAPLNTAPQTQRASRQNISRSTAGRGASGGQSLQEFKPTLKPKDPIDPAKVDPILKLALLAKLRTVGVEGGVRTLFDFSGAPVAGPLKPEVAKVKPILPGPKPFIGPIDQKAIQERAAAVAAAAPKPPPPPIPLKFYGFTNVARQGRKQAFFLEGEDIFVAAEGDMIKNRYKVVRIGVNSAVVEDTSNKHQQTLPLEAEGVAS